MAAKRKAAAKSSKAAKAPRTEAMELAPPQRPVVLPEQPVVPPQPPVVPPQPPVPPERPMPPERKKLAAADFYSALQRSLDTVQRQLSSANNAFADFVVKEFKIDAAVQMNINELGVLQLVLADDTMAPQSVSRVSLALAAVAKAQDDSRPQSLAKADMTALADLPWLPPQLVAQLAQFDVKTASEFLGLVADARFATQIVASLKFQRADVGRWANQMRLLELPGMTTEYVRILSELGLFAIADLAGLGEKEILSLKLPKALTTEMLMKWHDAAKAAMQ
jgi:hypothetical protein